VDGSQCVDYGSGLFCQPEELSIAGEESTVCYYWNDGNAPSLILPSKHVTISGINTIVPACESGLQCNSQYVGDNAPDYGTCGNSSGWFDTCSDIKGCQYPQVCYDGKCSFPKNVSSGVEGNNPLSCMQGISTGICLTDYVCSSGNCIGKNDNIPATQSNDCLNGISSGYSIVTQTFQSMESDPTDRVTTASWKSSNVIIPPLGTSIDDRTLHFTTFEDSSSNVSALFHVIGDDNYYVTDSTSSTNHIVSSHIIGSLSVTGLTYTDTDVGMTLVTYTDNYEGTVLKVAYSTTGKYYCLVDYKWVSSVPTSPLSPLSQPPMPNNGFGFSIIYYSTMPTFSDTVLKLDPYDFSFYSFNVLNNSKIGHIYSVSVDDRQIDPNISDEELRIFFVGSNIVSGTTMTNTTFDQAGHLVSAKVSSATVQQASVDINAATFEMISYTNFSPDNNVRWCQSYIGKTMDKTMADKYCYAYKDTETQVVAIRPNLQFLWGSSYQPIFPYKPNAELIPVQIGVFNSMTKEPVENESYYIGVQQSNQTNFAGVDLRVSFENTDGVLAGAVDLDTVISVPFIDSSIDITTYLPQILLLTKTCT
jgi:hypothetical protein